ncbi:hypothetical protein D3C85_1581380 [compost metagenome]
MGEGHVLVTDLDDLPLGLMQGRSAGGRLRSCRSLHDHALEAGLGIEQELPGGDHLLAFLQAAQYHRPAVAF